jgi:nucleotide-binding universal stress UspA family protein
MSDAPLSAASTEPIVVGVDGSQNSKEALRWAANYADITGSPLIAVTTWRYPESFGYPVAWPEDVDFETDATRMLNETVDAVLGDGPGAKVTRSCVSGHPALVLENLSRTASLLVVGSRGHGEFAGMLLGSVSEHLATHCHCPVVIIRGEGHPD